MIPRDVPTFPNFSNICSSFFLFQSHPESNLTYSTTMRSPSQIVFLTFHLFFKLNQLHLKSIIQLFYNLHHILPFKRAIMMSQRSNSLGPFHLWQCFFFILRLPVAVLELSSWDIECHPGRRNVCFNPPHSATTQPTCPPVHKEASAAQSGPEISKSGGQKYCQKLWSNPVDHV